MATHSDQDRGPAAADKPAKRSGPSRQLVEFDRFIEDQLRKTRSRVRAVDVAGSLMLLAAGTLVYFLVAAVFDHWIVTGGLGFWGRSLFLAVFVAGATAYLVTQLLPLVLHSINPVYAAQAIERSRPSLKNALVNFLFFRADPSGLNPVVYQAVEEQAATNLAKAHVDSAVDRSKLIRIGYALAGILLVCAVYTLASPKDLLKTIGRIAMPWAEISAPTRTTIVEIEPRDAQAFRGQKLTVSARIQGLPADGKATLFYSTADGQIVDRPLEMTLAEDGYKHACVLPGGEASLQQNASYRIEAGDAISRPFRIEVVAAPTIFVRTVEYKYPKYTGLLAQRVEQQGDLKGIEGTEVTIEAVTNTDIESAQVDFDCDGKFDQRMQTDGQNAKATFRLALADDRKTPWHESYQLIFKDAQGQQNPQPVRHQIEVTRDVPPEIEFLAPSKDTIDLPANGAVSLEVVANDPDFALKLVKLSAARGKEPLFDKLLLDEERRGQFVGKYRFEPLKLGLKVGDVVEYSALAEDNKDPRANRTETGKRRIRIVAANARRKSDDQLAQNQKSGDGRKQPGERGQRGDNNQERGDEAQDESKPEQAQPADGKKSQPGADDVESTRPEPSNPRDQEQESEEQDRQSPESGEDQQSGKQQSGDQQQGSDQKGGGEKGAGQQNGGEQQAAGDQKSDGDQKNVGGKSGQQQSGDKSGKAGQSKPADESVPSDGTDDGDAIERILKHRDEQKGKDNKDGDSADKQQGDRSADRRKNPDVQADRNQEDRDQRGGQSSQNGDQQSDGKRQSDNKSQGKDAAGDKSPPNSQRDSSQTKGDKSNPQQDQPGGKSQGGEKGQSGQKGQSGGKDKSDQKQGGQAGQKGDQGDQQSSGGGEKTERQKSAGQPSKDGADKSAGQSGDDQSANGGEKSDGEEPAGEKGEKSANSKGRPQSDRAKSSDKNAEQAAKQDSEAEQGAEADPQKAGDDSGGSQGDKPDGAGSDAQKSDRRGGATRQNSTPDKGRPDGQRSQGQGAQSKDDPAGGKDQPKSTDAQRPDAKGGDGERDKGESGAGQKSSDNQGSPSPDQANQPRKKSQPSSPGDEDPKDANQAQSPSNSKRESDSQGQDDGDRSGGGKRGGGQKANKPGTGGAGQNTAADEGSGTSDEAGTGEDSNRAGSDRQSDKDTGKLGAQKGNGSQTRPSTEQGGKPGADGDSESNSQSSGGQPKGSNTTPGGGTPAGGQPGAQPDDRRPANGPWKPGEDMADEANLDYARRATDLALAHLKDELKKDHPDPELLARLGWTRKDLESFVRRWEQMRKQAQTPGEQGTAAKQSLDETLKSLGLRPRATTQRGNSQRDDSARGMKESRRSSPPPEYEEQTKAYTQGTARGGK